MCIEMYVYIEIYVLHVKFIHVYMCVYVYIQYMYVEIYVLHVLCV